MVSPSLVTADHARSLSIEQEAVLALASEVRRVVTLARAMTLAGRAVSLSGLESAVGLVCAKTLNLAPNETLPVRAQLMLLGTDLDRLAAAIDPNLATLRGVPSA